MNPSIPIKAGATVGIFAPGSPAKSEAVAQGLAELTERGFQYKIAGSLTVEDYSCEHGFSCGPVAARAEALVELLEDAAVDAVLALRGGYGSLDLLSHIDFSQIETAKKPLIGYSDVSALLIALSTRTSVCAVHGPHLAVEFANTKTDSDAQESVEKLIALLQGSDERFTLKGDLLQGGESEGELLVSNLTMLCSLLGTPFAPDFTDKILVLEEVSEAPYRVQRLLTQLKLAGAMEKLKGVAFGRFSFTARRGGPSIEDVLVRRASLIFNNKSLPILKGIPVGHAGKNLPLPLGSRAKISEEGLTLLENPFKL